MRNNNDNTANIETVSVGTSFVGLLTIIFIVLKLTKVITWSWWWVLSPIWITWGLVIVMLFILGIASIALAIKANKKNSFKNKNKKGEAR